MPILPSPAKVTFDYVTPQIAQGSAPPGGSWLRQNGFTAVVFAAMEFQPEERFYPGVLVIRAALDDSGRPMSNREWSDALRASAQVATLVKKDHLVYSSCWMGLNRSGLISALSLHRLTGISGRRAADHVRKRRQGALNNPSFSAALDALPAAQKRLVEPPRMIHAPPAYVVKGPYSVVGNGR